MKKIMCKSLSILLAVIMLFTAVPMLVSAEAADAPEFAVEKVSETETTLELVLKLTSGSFLCFDASVTVKDLECTMAITTDEFDAFVKNIKKAGENGIDCENTENGKVSISVTESCSAPMDIVAYTFKKNDSKGINGSDVSFNFEFCYVDDGEGGEKNVTENVKAEVTLPATHVHAKNGKWVEVKPATCAETGLEELYCTECGELAESRDITMKEHANTRVDSKNATCTEDGYTDTYCDDCNQKISHQSIPATGHDTYEDIKPATCTEAGYRKLICKNCKEVIEEDIYPATNHAHTHEEKLDATCTEDGYFKIICDDCSKVISEETYPATGHGTTHTVRTEPTCTVDGSIAEVCDKCNQVVSSVAIPATGHKLGSEIEQKPATCTENGYVRYICETCGGIYEEHIIESKGHTIAEVITNPDCHHEGCIEQKCSLCNEVISSTPIPKTSHKWGEWVTNREPQIGIPGLRTRVCENCSDVQEEVIPALPSTLNGIELSVNDVSINYKKSISLYADTIPASAAYSTTIVWESSNPKVAVVDQNGIVTATGKGTATITASTADGKYSDSCNVTVTYSWLQYIIIYVLFGWIWY